MNVKTGKYHLSALLNSPVHNEAGRQCGQITDFTLTLRKNWPCFDQAVIFDFNRNCQRLAARKCFKEFAPASFVLSTPINDLPLLPSDFSKPTATQLWDKSVIDTINVRTVQINDLEILFDESGEIWVNGIDISFRAALRRLKLDGLLGGILERFGMSSSGEIIE